MQKRQEKKLSKRRKIYQNWPRNIGRVFFVSFVLFSHPVMSDSLQPHGLQHTRPPGPSPSPGVCPSSCSLHWWCHPAISSSYTLLSFCFQSFLASGAFPMNHLFTSDDQNTRASASPSGLPVNIQGWFPLRLTDLISLMSKGLSGLFSSTTVWRHQSFQWVFTIDFLLRFAGLISVLSQGLSRVFSSTIVRKHQSFGTLPSSLWSSSHIGPWLLETP